MVRRALSRHCGLLWCRYHRYRLPVLHRFWYWVPCCWFWLFGTYFHLFLDGCGVWSWWFPLKGSFSTSCTVSVAHAFFNRMGTVFLLTCLVVGRLGIGVREVSVCSRLPVSLCRADGWAACHCSQFTHIRVRFLLSLHWFDACLPAQYLHVWPGVQTSGSWITVVVLITKGLIRKLPYPLVNLSECCSIPVLLLPCLWVPTFVFPYSTWSSWRILVPPSPAAVVPELRKMVFPSWYILFTSVRKPPKMMPNFRYVAPSSISLLSLSSSNPRLRFLFTV